MPGFVFRFPGGHYHATPWGRHVNEGAVEWPPSPWRLLRALISVGHTAMGWDDGVPDAARELVTALASVPPTYRLPPASLGHTRHYMPQGVLEKGREKTALVFDAFAVPGDGVLSVTWPVPLPPGARDLLGELLRCMNHLGRAESLVEAALLPEGAPLPPGAECVPCAPGEPSRGPGWEQVSLLLPCPAEVYAHWREARVAEVLADPTLNPAPGRKATAALEKKRQKALAPYPEDLLACLVNTTSKLQAEGWSQPPGSQRVLYWRRDDALEVAARTRPRPTEDRRVEAVLLALSLPSGNLHALPPVTRALPQAELFHRSAVSRLGRGRPSEAGAELVGLDLEGVPLRGHRHAHVFPLDLDGDGHLDHLLVWAPGGLGREAVAAIRGVRETWTKGGADALRLAVAATGGLDALRGLPDPWGASLARLLGPARRWISLSPFVPPRHLKRGGANRLDGQVRAELASRGHPEPLSVGLLPAEEALARGFRHHVLARGRGGPPPPAPFGLGLEIRFTEPLRGPLCLGYGSHFGLGLMVAVPED